MKLYQEIKRRIDADETMLTALFFQGKSFVS